MNDTPPPNGDAAVPDPAGVPDAASFAGWGRSERITDLVVPEREEAAPHEQLGMWKATAICGNDITSSCLYVSALCAIYAGPYAPLALLGVAGLLFLFRGIYAEVGSALPLNGGAYNVLLNTSTKFKASIAACLTLLSYVATAVISANEAMHYAHNLHHGLPVFAATVALLFLFACLTIWGLGESAVVALVIFAFHMISLVLLVLAAGWVVLRAPEILSANWHRPPPDHMSMWKALFFGFSAALLGISGFESSANFIEEQAPGVFPKTLRNMWIAVSVFNPLIALLALGLIPLPEIAHHENDLLAEMGLRSFGPALQWVIGLDAVLVLSGAVLTSYVGVVGLVRRMTLDRCLPRKLLEQNRWRGTNHWIILGFFLVCCSILVLTQGQLKTLAGVYTISFLLVMALFAVGNLLLKVKRGRLPRATRSPWLAVLIALVGVSAGLVGQVILNPNYVKIFAAYFVVGFGVVLLMFVRLPLLRGLLRITRGLMNSVLRLSEQATVAIHAKIDEINRQSVVFFTRGDSVANLNRAALYVLANEQTDRLLVVHVYDDEAKIPENLAKDLTFLDQAYPQLRIDFLAVQGRFEPALVDALSERLEVPKNYMFIGCPGDGFPHAIDELGGVRLIV